MSRIMNLRSFASCRAHQRFELVEVFAKRFAPMRAELNGGHAAAPRAGLDALDERGLFKRAQVCEQIAVGEREHVAQVGERAAGLAAGEERGENREPSALVDHGVEIDQIEMFHGLHRSLVVMPRRVRFGGKIELQCFHFWYLARTTMPKIKCNPPKPMPSQKPGSVVFTQAQQPRQMNARPSQRKNTGAKKLTAHNPQPYRSSHNPAKYW